MNFLRKSRTIKSKLVVALVAFDLVLTGAFTLRTLQTQRDAILEGIDQRLHSAAMGITFVLPEGTHSRWKDSATIPDSVYVPLSRKLQSYADANGVSYLYSFMESHDSVVFFISSNKDSQFAKNDYVRFRTPYPEASDSLHACFLNGGTVYESTNDDWGSWRSALTRIRTQDGRDIVLGADIDIADIQRKLRMNLLHSLAIGALGFAVFLILLLKLASSITIPLMRVEEQTRKLVVQKFDLAGFDTSVLEGIWADFKDESGRLAHTFLLMISDLAEHIRRLKEETSLRNKIESEMTIAGEIQKNYLPKAPDARIAGRAAIAGDTAPARAAGGDLFDHFMLDDRRMVFALGDVSDKGMPAAIFMAISVTLLREGSYRGLRPQEVMAATNSSLYRHNDLCQFLTLFYGVLDLDTGDVLFVNAGHNPPFVLRADGRLEKVAQRHGPALGVLEGYAYKSGELHLEPGDTLVMYTDGVTEAFDPEGRLYGDHRLEALLADTAPGTDPASLLDVIWKDVALHVDGAPRSDDITTLIIRREGGATS